MNTSNKKTWRILFPLLFILLIASGCEKLDKLLNEEENDNGKDNQSEGKVEWYTALGSEMNSPAIGNQGNIYATYVKWIDNDTYTFLGKINPEGEILWEYEIGWSFSGSPRPMITPDGTVYVVWGKIHALDPSGNVKWTYKDPDGNNLAAGAVDANSNLYVRHNQPGSYTRQILSFNSEGNLRWAKDVDWGATYLTIGQHGYLYFEYKNWDENIMFTKASTASGSEQWNVQIDAYNNQGGVAIGNDGTIYFPDTKNDQLIAFDHTNGSIKWIYDCEGETPGIPSIGKNGNIYFSARDLNAVSSDGTLLWEYDIINSYTPEVAIDNNGVIYVNSIVGDKIVAVNDDGTLNWENESVKVGYHHSPAISSSGMIYIATGLNDEDKNGIVAIKGSSGLATSCWPRAFKDNRNSGCY